eukprot:1583001-Amphidinium_carterae.1
MKVQRPPEEEKAAQNGDTHPDSLQTKVAHFVGCREQTCEALVSSSGVVVDAGSSSTGLGKRKHEETPDSTMETPAKVGALAYGTGSVWESCQAQAVQDGVEGLIEAKDALEQGLARQALGGLASLKAEKEIVGWLKGLTAHSVS